MNRNGFNGMAAGTIGDGASWLALTLGQKVCFSAVWLYLGSNSTIATVSPDKIYAVGKSQNSELCPIHHCRWLKSSYIQEHYKHVSRPMLGVNTFDHCQTTIPRAHFTRLIIYLCCFWRETEMWGTNEKSNTVVVCGGQWFASGLPWVGNLEPVLDRFIQPECVYFSLHGFNIEKHVRQHSDKDNKGLPI